MARRKTLTTDHEKTILLQAGSSAAQRRKALGLTQQDVAADIGVQNSALSNFETGRNYLATNHTVRLCWRLQMGMGDLYYGLEHLLHSDTTYQRILELLPTVSASAHEAILGILLHCIPPGQPQRRSSSRRRS
jgi:transcriptional regulator with XRE-family HTH domain